MSVSGDNPLTGIVRSGLKTASADSLISTTIKSEQTTIGEASPALQKGGATVKLEDGRALKVSHRGEDVTVELVEGGTTQASPSGRYTLADGKSIVVDNGKVTGGDVFSKAAFAMFALMSEK
jgi:hypothetical protein